MTSEETHAPIGNVEVCAFADGEESEPEACAPTSVVDGSYLISNLAPGTYEVEFWPRFALDEYAYEFYDDQLDLEHADPVEVLDGATTAGIDAELAAPSSIGGKVLGPLGEPLEEVEVCAVPEGPGYERCTLTEEEGEYLLDRLPPNSYKAWFDPFLTGLNLLEQFWDHKPTSEAAEAVVLGPGEAVSGIDADLEAGAEIRGTVRSAATGSPLGGIVVCAFKAVTGELWSCDKTSPGGSYSLWWLEGGLFKVGFAVDRHDFLPDLFPQPEPQGYPTQFYNGKTTLAAADVLTTKPPAAITGIDASLGSPPVVPAPTPIAKPEPKPLKCKRGFTKKRVKGKARCVKVHKHRRHHRAR
ncbi:MAG TPA: carboxypeptidase-like regulatory domain-containing protein [Solirubrobacterales bacterium]|nr:carboxypeptidase-like regulatory domain-containing protein [Solirubrobacterales bacterium]